LISYKQQRRLCSKFGCFIFYAIDVAIKNFRSNG
jgi:hypothetical protein